jgi:benzoyl-CoA reductase/2-hydroxyglutaryl-CoA dehydratase subunit BcrC/BadD/HgdB
MWRDLSLLGLVKLDKLIVVAGGDCNNAIVDGERLERSGIDTHYFIYPFDGSPKKMKEEIQALLEFLGGDYEKEVFKTIGDLKKKALDIDALRTNGKTTSRDAFSIEVSGSDLSGDPELFKQKMKAIEKKDRSFEYRVALLGTPPIYPDFHDFLDSLGLIVVYDEMPFSFIQHCGTSLNSLARNYADYTFARNISYRINKIKNELKARKVDGVIHFHQFACHHKLEDPILRESLGKEGYPFITIEGDLPSKTPSQTQLRLEAFKEMLGEFS